MARVFIVRLEARKQLTVIDNRHHYMLYNKEDTNFNLKKTQDRLSQHAKNKFGQLVFI